MEFLHNLSSWVEEHYDNATSYGLEVCRDADTAFRTYKSGKVEDVPDPGRAGEEIYLWAQEFRANNADGKWRAMMRVHDGDGGFTKVVKAFFLPPAESNLGNPFALSSEELDKSPGLKVFMQLMDGERKRTESSLQVSKMREDTLFETILEMKRENREDLVGLLGEMREERTMMREDMREERKAHDDRIGPIIKESANALSNAAGLVRIHQDNNTVVQLAKLEREAEKERMEMYFEIGGPLIKKLASRFGKRKKQQHPTMPINTDQDDQEPPNNGPTSELFFIFEKLEDTQLEDVKRILPEGMFDRLDNAAHSGDDGQTTVALGELKVAYEKHGKLKGFKKLMDLSAVLGDELSEKFLALFDAAPAEPEEEDEPEEEPIDNVFKMRKKDGYVAGLRKVGFSSLDDDKQVAIGEQLGARLTGVLIGGAEGDDEDKAFAALCTLGARLNELTQESGEQDAEDRFKIVLNILDDDDGLLFELVGQVAEELEPE